MCLKTTMLTQRRNATYKPSSPERRGIQSRGSVLLWRYAYLVMYCLTYRDNARWFVDTGVPHLEEIIGAYYFG